jgi:hypothetical protein
MSLNEKLEKARNTAPTDWLTEGMTNGDVIEALFPKLEKMEISEDIISVHFPSNGAWVHFESYWWNAPYKPQEGVEED